MIVGFNPLRPIENLLTDLLEWFHSTIGLTWAWSIVALVVLVRLVLVPVTVRQIHSMQNLQAHAPEMKEIQQKWKHDRQRQNEELMKFYRENKINPAASCLPIVRARSPLTRARSTWQMRAATTFSQSTLRPSSRSGMQHGSGKNPGGSYSMRHMGCSTFWHSPARRSSR